MKKKILLISLIIILLLMDSIAIIFILKPSIPGIGGLAILENKEAGIDSGTGENIPAVTESFNSISTSGSSRGGGSGGGSSGGSSSGSGGEDSSPIILPQKTYDVYLSSDSYTGNKNSEFIINIKIKTQEKIYATEFELNFNSEILDTLEVVKGGFLGKDGAETYEVINKESGKIIFASTRLGTQAGVSGEGNLAQIKFKAKNSGNTDLTLINTNIADTTLTPGKFKSNIQNGRVRVF